MKKPSVSKSKKLTLYSNSYSKRLNCNTNWGTYWYELVLGYRRPWLCLLFLKAFKSRHIDNSLIFWRQQLLLFKCLYNFVIITKHMNFCSYCFFLTDNGSIVYRHLLNSDAIQNLSGQFFKHGNSLNHGINQPIETLVHPVGKV